MTRALTCVAFLACIMALGAGPARASNHEDATATFREANSLYAQERYREAAALYEATLESGFRNADVQYNLGNAYYKAGQLGPAVLAYERALELRPTHEDAAANLAFVQELLPDRRAPVGGAMSDLLADLTVRLTSHRLALLASAFHFTLFGILTLRVLRREIPGWLVRTAVVAAVGLVLAGGLLSYRLARERARVEGVIMAAEVGVRTGPGEDFVLEFRLHEGTKVRVEERRGNWARVALDGTDLDGWMPAAAFEEI